jgi:hypothetical protein
MEGILYTDWLGVTGSAAAAAAEIQLISSPLFLI